MWRLTRTPGAFSELGSDHRACSGGAAGGQLEWGASGGSAGQLRPANAGLLTVRHTLSVHAYTLSNVNDATVGRRPVVWWAGGRPAAAAAVSGDGTLCVPEKCRLHRGASCGPKPHSTECRTENETLPGVRGSAGLPKWEIQCALDLQGSVHPLPCHSKTTGGVPEQAWCYRQLKSGAPAT